MGFLESLQGLLSALGPDEIDITVRGDDIDIGDIDSDADVRIKSGDHPTAAIVSEEAVVLYPDQLQGAQYAKFCQLVRAVKREQGRVTRVTETSETRALEGVDTTDIDQTVAFFEGLVSDRHASLLKSALYLQQLKNEGRSGPDFDIDQKKAELKDRYGYEAYYVSHLASSGYFSPDRYFRDLYHELEAEAGPTPEQYRDEFEMIIGEKLIATFVNADDELYDVKAGVKAGLAKHFRHRPRANFFDVRGLGPRCRETIDRTISDLSSEYEHMQYENNDRNEERAVRIYPATLQDFDI